MRALTLFAACMIANGSMAQSGYWQQRADFKISVRLDDTSHTLHGSERITYVNNSPDKLDFLIFHLWPNAYKNRQTALAKQLLRLGKTDLHFASEDERGYIDSLDFKIDGVPCNWEYDSQHIDICTLNLNAALHPGDSIVVETPFRVKLPSGNISRLGHDGQAYYITQWYPKPAVYDATGWHGMPYLTLGEFYSEFGSFEVNITLPENYTIGATGDLQNASEIARLEALAVKTERWLENREANLDWKTHSENMDFPPSETAQKTLTYTQQNVHDFAWFADKRFHVLKGEVVLPHSGDSVEVWTLFTNKNARVWKESIEYMHDGVYYYSLWNGDYPYRQATAVDGTISAGAGMEYPNVTVIGSTGSNFLLEQVIVHEIGHNWFYGILGSNERDHPWMDEGINSFNELRYMNTKYPNGAMLVGGDKVPKLFKRAGADKYRVGDLHYLSYLYSARQNSDQALNLPANEYDMVNYGTIVYAKAAVVFDHLRDYLGDSLMDAAMQRYFEKFKFKHPQPEDVKRVFEQVTEKDLDWFFDDMLSETGKYDYQLKRAKTKPGKTEVKLCKRGKVMAPVSVELINGDSVRESMWIEPFERDTLIVFDAEGDRVVIDKDWRMPEVKRDNNASRTKGIFKRVEPIELSLIGKLENPNKNQLHWLPVFGATVPGGFMPGIAIYNSLLPVKRLNYAIAPMYSIRNTQINGLSEVYYMFTPNGSWFESIDVGVRGKRFQRELGLGLESASFVRAEPYLRFELRPPKYNGFWDHTLEISSVYVNEQWNVEQQKDVFQRFDESNFYTRLNYKADYKNPILPTKIEVCAEHHEDFFRMGLELNNDARLTKKLVWRSRAFAATFLDERSNLGRYMWQVGGQNGETDYAYDVTFFDRSVSDNTFGRQMTLSHGALKFPTRTAVRDLVAYNGQLSYKKIPIGVFGDAVYTSGNNFMADAGLCVTLFNDFFSFYVPMIYTSNLRQEANLRNWEWSDLIRFQIKIDQLNPMRLRRNFKLS